MIMRKTAVAIVVVLVGFVSVGCQQRVVRETSYSPEQFPQYSHLPRASDQQQDEEAGTDWIGKTTGGVKRVTNSVSNGARKVGRTIGGMFPSWGDE
jgi:hypothetical protein